MIVLQANYILAQDKDDFRNVYCTLTCWVTQFTYLKQKVLITI